MASSLLSKLLGTDKQSTGGVLSQGTGMSGGVLSRQPQSMFDRLGFDLSDPSNQVALAFANNIISTPGASPFQGVAEAAQNGQQMQARKTELSQIVKKQRQEDDQSAQLKQMMAGDPQATQFLLAGRPDEAMKIYAKNKGLDLRASGDSSYGQQPVFLTDESGTQHIGQMSSGGGVLVDGKSLPGLPKGWQVTARPDNLRTLDTGGGISTFNPNNGTTLPLIVKQGAPSANLDVTANPDGTRIAKPMAGSPEAVKARGDRTAAQTSLGALEQKQGLVAGSIDHAVQIAQAVPSTGIFSLANAVPGTPQYDLKSTLDTIKANVGFDQLQQMRDNSPTGGALGQVSEQENRLLQSVLGSLDQAQSKDQFIANLTALKDALSQSTDARRRAFAQDFPDMGGDQGAGSGAPGFTGGGGGGGGKMLPDPFGMRQ